MKSPRLFLLPLLAAALVAPLSAQPKPAAIVKTVEPARIAYLNSNAFLDPNSGIKALVKVNQTIELEFAPTQQELGLMSEKLRTLIAELNKLNADPVANAKAMADKKSEGLRLQQEIQAKQQAAQEAVSKKAQEIQAPVMREIGGEMQAFAKERDIDLLFDAAKMGEILLQAKPDLDLTKEFIR